MHIFYYIWILPLLLVYACSLKKSVSLYCPKFFAALCFAIAELLAPASLHFSSLTKTVSCGRFNFSDFDHSPHSRTPVAGSPAPTLVGPRSVSNTGCPGAHELNAAAVPSRAPANAQRTARTNFPKCDQRHCRRLAKLFFRTNFDFFFGAACWLLDFREKCVRAVCGGLVVFWCTVHFLWVVLMLTLLTLRNRDRRRDLPSDSASPCTRKAESLGEGCFHEKRKISENFVKWAQPRPNQKLSNFSCVRAKNEI